LKLTFLEPHAAVLPAVLLLAGVPSAGAAETPAPRYVIIQPGYPGSTGDARNFMATLTEYLTEKAGLKGLDGEYHNETRAGLAHVASARPTFGVVSLGFYLAHRKQLELKPLLQAKPRDRLLVVARAGDVKDPAALKGEPVAGGPLHEPEFLARVAFHGKADVASWDRQAVLHASRALRDLTGRRRYRAVVLTGRDHAALEGLYPAKTLEIILESDYYPPALVVACGRPEAAEAARADGQQHGAGETGAKENVKEKAGGGTGASAKDASPPGRPLLPEELDRVVRAFSGLTGDPRGKDILSAMGAEGFEAVPRDWLQELEGSYDARTEKK
jgi:hypothetical protein